jgi:hypothetical protein
MAGEPLDIGGGGSGTGFSPNGDGLAVQSGGANLYLNTAGEGEVEVSAASFRIGVSGGYVQINGSKVFTGNGSPEGVVAAPVSSFYLREDGGAGTCFYVKESGTGNTGWVAK